MITCDPLNTVVLSRSSEFINSLWVYPVDPPLVEKDEENNIWRRRRERREEKETATSLCSDLEHCYDTQLVYVYLSTFLSDVPSLKQPILYMVGILITKANMSSMKVLRALYVSILQGRWATDLSL